MSASAWDRFEELDAGRIIGDLTSEEISEWQSLATDQGDNNTIELELIATELELQYTQPSDLTSSLSNKLLSTIPAFSNKAKTTEPPSDKNISILPWLGWAVAACLVVVFNIPKTKQIPVAPLTIAQKYEALITDNVNTQRLAFTPVSDPYKKISGEVIWNDALQEGYMSLASLPVNDPTQNQYQLWIVDPVRDEFPVDGGVFDISSSTGPAIIPIRNALQVNKPIAFVITLEQPGGVVKSKLEVVVAQAKS